MSLIPFSFKNRLVIIFFLVGSYLTSTPAHSVQKGDLEDYAQEKMIDQFSSVPGYGMIRASLVGVKSEGQKVLFRRVVQKLVEINGPEYQTRLQRLFGDQTSVQIESFRAALLEDFTAALPYCQNRLHGKAWANLITEGPDSYLRSPAGRGDFGKVWNTLAANSSLSKANTVVFRASANLVEVYKWRQKAGYLSHITLGARYIQNETQLDYFEAISDSANFEHFFESPADYESVYDLIADVNRENIRLVKHAIAMDAELWRKRGYPESPLVQSDNTLPSYRLEFLTSLIRYVISVSNSFEGLDRDTRMAKEKALLKLLSYMPNFYQSSDKSNIEAAEITHQVKVFGRLKNSLLYLDLMKKIIDAVASQVMVDYIDYVFSVKLMSVVELGHSFNRVEVHLESLARFDSLLDRAYDHHGAMQILAIGMNGSTPISIEKLEQLNKKVKKSHVNESAKSLSILESCRKTFRR